MANGQLPVADFLSQQICYNEKGWVRFQKKSLIGSIPFWR